MRAITQRTRIAPRTVYVSSSAGSDSNTGLAADDAKATLAAAKAMIRDDVADRLLLARGDSWSEPIGEWSTSGQDDRHAQLIGAYGAGVRPIVKSGAAHGIWTASGVDHVRIEDVAFRADRYDGTNGKPSGVAWRGASTGLTLRRCVFEGYRRGIDLDSGSVSRMIRDVVIEGCQVIDCREDTAGEAAGIYGYRVFGVRVDANLIHRVGVSNITTRQHGIHLVGTRLSSPLSCGITLANNLIADCGGAGIKSGAGWTMGRFGEAIHLNNLIARCGAGIWIGDGGGPASAGSAVTSELNVVIAGVGRGWGLVLEDVARFTSVLDLIVNVSGGSDQHPIVVHPSYPTDLGGSGVRKATFEGLVVRGWPGSILLNGAVDSAGGNAIERSHVDSSGDHPVIEHVPAASASMWRSSENHLKSAAPDARGFRVAGEYRTLAQWKALLGDGSATDAVIPSWPAPTRSIGSYAGVLGLTATHDAFMAAARASWGARPEHEARAVNAYIRGGFDL